MIPEAPPGARTNGLAPVSVAERSLAAGAWQWAGLVAVALAAVIADQVTKHVVTRTLELDDSVHVAGPLTIHHVQNSGIAFGLFSQATAVVTLVTAAAVVWMVVFFARSGSRHPVLPAALGLLIGGSLSNLVDRIRLHHVTDFIDLGFWPAFNLADTLHRRRRRDPARRPRARGPQAASAAPHARRRGSLNVPATAAGERLDRFLAAHLGSRAAAERAIDAGALVDGIARPKSFRLEGGEEVVLQDEVAVPDLPAPPEPAIVWEDEHVLVIDKPPGLVVHPGAGHPSGTLVHALAGKIAGGDPARPGVVHRLDRDTSGLMALARSEESHQRLTELVRERAFERTYTALVHGRPRSRTGRIEAPIGRDRGDATRVSLDTDTPREAITNFEVERVYPAHALLRVRLETGRMHQIRVHLAAIDLPVAGDATYGTPEPNLPRQFLHASELAFPHPFSGERVETASPLPDDLASFLASLA